MTLLVALHLLGAIVWVGGMFFALAVLRPSLAVLEPALRLALHREVFRRFFAIVWVVIPVMFATGLAMLFGFYDGFRGAPWTVHLMTVLGIVMTAVFLAIVRGPWRALQSPETNATAAASLTRIRTLVTVNLALGLLTAIVAVLNY
jgi:uncharacterized membrane protein